MTSQSSVARLGLLVLAAILGGAEPAPGQEPPVIPLWEKGAPGFEDRRNEP
jgi:hypothetical protein